MRWSSTINAVVTETTDLADILNTALGHNRLSINDLTPAGHQPLHNEKQTVHAVVNGEIYDYDRLRTEMVEKEDYQFQGRSDCELVLALYQCYGTAFVSHLRGEFALCLYDAERELFLAVRDRYGIKPLFWTVLDRELLVAAEMKALRPLGWEPEWNVKAIVDGSFQIGQTTIFKDVQKVSIPYTIRLEAWLTSGRFSLVICSSAGISVQSRSNSTGTWSFLTKFVTLSQFPILILQPELR